MEEATGPVATAAPPPPPTLAGEAKEDSYTERLLKAKKKAWDEKK
jgi:hypothetical protein